MQQNQNNDRLQKYYYMDKNHITKAIRGQNLHNIKHMKSALK